LALLAPFQMISNDIRSQFQLHLPHSNQLS